LQVPHAFSVLHLGTHFTCAGQCHAFILVLAMAHG